MKDQTQKPTHRVTWREALFATLLVLVVALGAREARALANPIGGLLDVNVSVGAVTAMDTNSCAAGDPCISTGAGTGASSIVVQNESTTCIRVGGPNVSASRGFSVGSGCAMGSAATIDGRRFWMISTSGTVNNVTLTWGN